MGRPAFDRPLTRKSINIFSDQLQKLAILYPAIPFTDVVRDLLDRHINKIEHKLQSTEKERTVNE